MGAFANFKNPVISTDKNQFSRQQRASLDQARTKTVELLQAQKLYAIDDTNPEPRSNLKPVKGGNLFGIRYSTSYLDKIFQDELTDPFTKYIIVTDEDLPAAYDLAIQMVTEGKCDAAIDKIRNTHSQLIVK